jgi:hypothetical protein
MDPRCVAAHRFCTMFCAFALRHGEEFARHRLPKYTRVTIREVTCLIAQRQESRVGRRACSYPKRILRHVLTDGEFVTDDTGWLCTTISAFLFVMERSIGQERSR